MNNPFDYSPDETCRQAFAELVARIESFRYSDNPQYANLYRELSAGKMLGVLIATDGEGVRHTLYAFSGQLGSGGFDFPGFVGPVFDYLDPDGYFKSEEAHISRLNREISHYEKTILFNARTEYEQVKQNLDAEIETLRAVCKESKSRRDVVRAAGAVDEQILADMIRQSQYEKAELNRLRKRVAMQLAPYSEALDNACNHIAALRERRRRDSENLQKWLFDNFRLMNAHGQYRSLSEIFADTTMGVPPSGAGECCAPKLLHAAFREGWHPQSMAEYWFGRPKDGEIRRHGEYYPACRGKCLPILRWMLQGLTIEPPLDDSISSCDLPAPKIIYENKWFCVVEKPSGMLSVPGKCNAISLQERLISVYGEERNVRVAHRLDRDTSGLMIATFGEHSYRIMQSLFATRCVSKTYVADLDGDYMEREVAERGCIDLPLSPDFMDRPRQRVDHRNGKEAVTEYEFIGASGGVSRVIFRPRTGRTHQLRVHAASAEGLDMPIAGDRLYGINAGGDSQRLHLHAHRIEFTFPIDAHHYSFESPVPF